MRRTVNGIALACLLVTGGPALASPDQRARATGEQDVPNPQADHHLHLVSPAFAAILAGPLLPAVQPPQELAALLDARADRWSDAEALAGLYTDDATVLIESPPKSGLFRGREVVARFLSTRFARPYRLTPVAWSSSGRVAHVTGYYSRGEGAGATHLGYFQLGLARGPDGWRIQAETPAFPGEKRQEPVTADQLVAMLDTAGVRRGVLLSTAAAVGGRWVDFYREESTPAERRAQVAAENDWTAQQASRFPDRLVAFCSFNPLEPYALDELRRCAAGGFRGLKLHFDESAVDLRDPQHVAKVRAVFAAANTARLPIVVHVANNEGTAAENRTNVLTFLDRIVAAAPDIAVQVAHLWGGSSFSGSALAAYAEATSSRHPATHRLYFDVAEATLIAERSGERKQEILTAVAAAIRQVGVERVLFGSDAAGNGRLSSGEAWRQFRSEVPLTQDEFSAIAGNVAPYLR